jgi:hypothetical protein
MPTYGLSNQRDYPRLEVLRGFDPQNPSAAAGWAEYPVKAGVSFLSGQIISPEYNATTGVVEWVKGAANGVPHFALEDSTDEDGVAAGRIPALSCEGDFLIQTPHYEDTTYVFGDKIVAGTSGEVGKVTKAGASDGDQFVIGRIDRHNGPSSIKGTNSNVKPAGQTDVLTIRTGAQPAHAHA